MTLLYGLQPDACIRDWLIRVDTQYEKSTPEKVKEADYDRAKKSLGLGNITNNYFFSSARPALYIPPQSSRGLFSGDTTTTTNSHNTTNVYNTTRIYNAPESSSDSDSEDAKSATKKKKTKEEKTDWKGIAAIGIVSTAVAGISIFVYARLSKAAEGARNYLENTESIKKFSETSTSPTDLTQSINQIAHIQLKIDQRAVDKITNYKYSILTSLVGTLAIAGGGITILAAAPALATTGTAALATAGIATVVVGGVLNSIAVMHAAYNCGMHWSDEEEGKKVLIGVKQLIPNLLKSFKSDGLQFSRRSYSYDEERPGASDEYGRPPAYFEGHPSAPQHSEQPSAHGEFSRRDPPPSYGESQAYQAIYNQRAGVYPLEQLQEMRELSGIKY